MKPVLRKTCVVKSNHGFFKIYISQAGQGIFWGNIVLDDRSGSWQAGDDRALQIKSKHFTGDSEQAALAQCSEWIREWIDPGAVISEL